MTRASTRIPGAAGPLVAAVRVAAALVAAAAACVGPAGGAARRPAAEAERPPVAEAERPNVVLIYADDLGYGDVSSYGATRVRTPNVDRLAAEGLRLTNGHSTSATCTPSRYALLTGQYPWRRPGTAIAAGDTPLIIEPGRTTLASVFKRAGYRTGIVGKWHLGLGAQGGPDWNGEIRPGPLELGFDEAFLIPATGDRVPTVYVENRRVVGLDPRDPIRVSYAGPVGDEPTGRARPDLLRMAPAYDHDQAIVNGVSRIGYMAGGCAARWVDEHMADTLAARAVRFVERQARAPGRAPFFLFFSTHDIHVPRLPHPRFAGRSGLGPRGDALLQFDSAVGEVLAALDRLGLRDNTLVLLSSDNGPVLNDGYRDQAVERAGGHDPSGPLRAGKGSAFEGGTRVPFLVRWPGHVRPDTSGALVSQVDLLASMAALTGARLAPADAPDSHDVLAALLGRDRRGRAHLVEDASTLALVRGRWKYIAPSTRPALHPLNGDEMGTAPRPQLYDLAADVGEQRDLAAERPDTVRALAALLRQLRADGRSRPGADR